MSEGDPGTSDAGGGGSFWTSLPALLTASAVLIGAVVIERVFVLPGLGSLLLDAVGARDLLVVQDVVMVLVVAVLLVNFLVDLLYLVLDPRLRTSLR